MRKKLMISGGSLQRTRRTNILRRKIMTNLQLTILNCYLKSRRIENLVELDRGDYFPQKLRPD